jgi:hypothetical protein
VSGVFINGVFHFEETVHQVERQLGVRLFPGRYWYDRKSGLAGYEGQGASAVLMAGLDLGGPLRADVSNGTSGVILNGRQLTHGEVAYLTGLMRGPIFPGRYWLDAQGNAGQEGGPALVNLVQLARSASNCRTTHGPDGWTWGNPATGNSASGDGGRNIAVFGPEGLIYSQGD